MTTPTLSYELLKDVERGLGQVTMGITDAYWASPLMDPQKHRCIPSPDRIGGSDTLLAQGELGVCSGVVFCAGTLQVQRTLSVCRPSAPRNYPPSYHRKKLPTRRTRRCSSPCPQM